MKELVTALAIALVFVAVVNTEDDDDEDDLWYPLPLFTRVKVDSTVSRHSAVISVNYRAPDRSVATWFVDGFPIPENRVDFNAVNIYDKKKGGVAHLSLSRDKERSFSLCLHNTPGQACLRLRRLPTSQLVVENLDFPWPLLIPAPLSRYDEDERMVVHAPVLETPHNYTYSAHLISHNPTQFTGRIVQEDTHGMSGGSRGDKLTIAPASYGGWEITLATDDYNYEGVLIVTTTFAPTEDTSRLVEWVKADRPIVTYRRDHRYPFSPGFVATVTNRGQRVVSPWHCQEGYDCLAECPLVSNGEARVTLSRVNGLNAGFMNTVQEAETVLRIGPYYRQARFVIRNFNRTLDAGTYLCQASTHHKTAISSVVVD